MNSYIARPRYLRIHNELQGSCRHRHELGSASPTVPDQAERDHAKGFPLNVLMRAAAS
jgi:hypothetical protein